MEVFIMAMINIIVDETMIEALIFTGAGALAAKEEEREVTAIGPGTVIIAKHSTNANMTMLRLMKMKKNPIRKRKSGPRKGTVAV